MEKEQFERSFQQLTPRRKEVLERFLSGQGDSQIGQLLYITENTVRQHIRKLCIDFGLTDDIEDYWRFHRTQEGVVVEQAIANLIIEQFNRLQQVCPTAYQLLYRMRCFRFQDVPTVPREGLLCLLWGIVEYEGVKAIRDLGDRGLVERVNGEYKLHPLIRQEAVKRLQDSEDWEQANCTAAEFWRNLFEYVKNIDQLKKSFEAFHHYFAIPDYESAVEILVEDRKADWISPYPFKSKWYKQETLSELIPLLSNWENTCLD